MYAIRSYYDATATLDFALNRLASVIENLVINEDVALDNLNKLGGLIFSQRVLLSLTQAGVSRENAYKIVQTSAMKIWEDGGHFVDLLKSNEEVTDKLSIKEIEDIFDMNYHTKNIDTIFNRVFSN